MLLSTSNSSSTGTRTAFKLLLGGLALSAVAAELLGPILFTHLSRIQRRIKQEYGEAVTLRAAADDGRPTLLLAGNSLLLQGIDFPRFQKELQPRYHAARFVVEGTQYLDWYFGLRRLFRAGSRPRVVVLLMSSPNLVSSATRGEYFAHFLLNSRDVFALAKMARLDNTTASNYLMASWSGWLGSRVELRKFLLSKSIPGIEGMTRLMAVMPPTTPMSDFHRPLIFLRLQELNRLCQKYGSEFVFILPPTPNKKEDLSIAEAAGSAAGMVVLVPSLPGEMPTGLYEDGYHLNPEGASLFTSELIDRLKAARFGVHPIE